MPYDMLYYSFFYYMEKLRQIASQLLIQSSVATSWYDRDISLAQFVFCSDPLIYMVPPDSVELYIFLHSPPFLSPPLLPYF